MATIVTLLLIGAVLLLLETVLPGMIAGLVGFGCLVAGVVIAYSEFGLRTGNVVLGIVVVGLVVGTLCWMRFLPDSPMARLFISRGKIGTIGAEKPELLNRTGTTLTLLRPSGTAMIDGQRVDVVSEGQLIEKGSRIKVVAI